MSLVPNATFNYQSIPSDRMTQHHVNTQTDPLQVTERAAQKELRKDGSTDESLKDGTSKTPEIEAETEKLEEPVPEQKESVPNANEEVDIDLNDPEVHAAAAKIQASLKGHVTRKQMSAQRSAGQTPTDGEQKVEEENKPSESDASQQPETTTASAEVKEPVPEEQEKTAANADEAAAEPEASSETAQQEQPEAAESVTEPTVVPEEAVSTPADTENLTAAELAAPKEDPVESAETTAESTSEQPAVKTEVKSEVETEVNPEVAAVEPKSCCR
ncbi:neuromodulin-like [Watersipora subatra]|uniref:neuromodulin-like n=1 Tax=Watersipora subatra TaxID=2589382 RepID=UPI00355B1007